jgi:DNA polymerase V
MIMRGRQFGEDTRDFYGIESATASLAARAASALRRERQLARQATVSLRTNRHKPGYQQISQTARFHTPTADTGLITSQLVQLLADTFNPRPEYHRADVLLTNFVPEEGLQTDLLGAVNLTINQESLRKMRVLDSINQQHGKGTIKFAAESLSQAWQPRKRLVSPRYTSAWDELPEVHLR